MITRLIMEQVTDSLKLQPVTILLGPRQVGKTTLAKEIANNSQVSAIYLDLENPNDLYKIEDGYNYLNFHHNKCIIIDEIQQKPELFIWLRSLVDENRIPGRFLLLGSANPSLIKNVSESLAGRVAYLELSPISLLEARNSDINMLEHWFRGGFPLALTTLNEKNFLKWMDNFITSYIERDLSKFFNLTLSPTLIRRLWSMFAHAQGNLWNASLYGKSLGISNHTVQKYFDYMEGAYLLRRLPSWTVNARKRIVKSPKVYVRDSGLLHRLCNILSYETLLDYNLIGLSWEGYVVEQICISKTQHLDAFFYRTQQGGECDIVLVKGLKPVASIEIKFSDSPKIPKGFYTSIADLQTKNNFVITPASETFSFKNNIVICSLEDFLKNHLPLL